MDTDEETIDPTEVHLTKKVRLRHRLGDRVCSHYPCESVSIRGCNRIVPPKEDTLKKKGAAGRVD